MAFGKVFGYFLLLFGVMGILGTLTSDFPVASWVNSVALSFLTAAASRIFWGLVMALGFVLSSFNPFSLLRR